MPYGFQGSAPLPHHSVASIDGRPGPQQTPRQACHILEHWRKNEPSRHQDVPRTRPSSCCHSQASMGVAVSAATVGRETPRPRPHSRSAAALTTQPPSANCACAAPAAGGAAQALSWMDRSRFLNGMARSERQADALEERTGWEGLWAAEARLALASIRPATQQQARPAPVTTLSQVPLPAAA